LAKFRFGLETLLRHREGIEQREKDEFSRRTYRYQIELRKRLDLSAALQETMKELSLKQSENAPHQELDYFCLYLNRLNQEIRESEKRLVRLQSEVQSQKEVLVEVTKKRKTLTAMRTKKEAEHRIALERLEQKEIDELVVTRYAGRESEYAREIKVRRTEANTKHE